MFLPSMAAQEVESISFGSVKQRKGGKRKRRRERSTLEVREFPPETLAPRELRTRPACMNSQEDDSGAVMPQTSVAAPSKQVNTFSVRCPRSWDKPLERHLLTGSPARQEAQTSRKAKASRSGEDSEGALAGGPGTYSSTGAKLQEFDAAFAERTIDTETDRDAVAVYERKLAAQASAGGDPAASGDLVQRSKDDLSRRKAFGTLGPMRAPSNIRSSTVMDHQPDICKDYYETGYCGWGDACKFLHMREKFTAGWKQEADWQSRQRKRNAALAAGLNVDAEGRILDSDGKPTEEGGKGGEQQEEELPYACFICRKPWAELVPAGRRPVESQCKHYTCEPCALARYKTNTTCAACGKETYGVFNRAAKILERLDKALEASGEKPVAAAPAAPTGGGWGSVTVVAPEAV